MWSVLSRVPSLSVSVLLFLLCWGFAFPHLSFGQESVTPLSLTIAPPYTNIILAPGTRWQSVLEVTNGSTYPVTVRARVRDVRPGSEGGVIFVERGSTPTPYALATWVQVPLVPLVIQPAQTVALNYAIDIPHDAEPGGHYAALLVESEPEGGVEAVRVSTALSSILLVRVSGEVEESGYIQSFEADDIVSRAQVGRFHLRFTNTGNVHIEPRGDIRILNMFGRERGRLTVGQADAFGPVLPRSTKDYVFSWEGDPGFLDIGVYRARAELRYGEIGIHDVYETAYFFIFPVVPTLLLCGGALLFLYLLKRIVRAMSLEMIAEVRQSTPMPPHHARERKASPEHIHQSRRWLRQLQQSPLLMIFFAVMLALIGFYFYRVLESERSYLMRVERQGPAPLQEQE